MSNPFANLFEWLRPKAPLPAQPPEPQRAAVAQAAASRMVTDWSRYPNFSEAEFRCRHTGRCEMQAAFMDVLQAIRTEYGMPMAISSGYRHPSHPAEARKGHTTGEHTRGACCDVAVQGEAALRLVRIALAHGITRIGVQQNGGERFLHLGIGGEGLPAPTIWSY